MYCKYCGKDIGDSVFCPNCQQQMGYDILLRDATHDSESGRINDVPNIFVIVLAFFIPIFGYIYYATGNVRMDYGFDGVPELFE
jgi:hypothetical protein